MLIYGTAILERIPAASAFLDEVGLLNDHHCTWRRHS